MVQLSEVQESGTEAVQGESEEAAVSGYDSPQDALKELGSEYKYWSGKLTDSSLQMCYALIGANWVVFRSVEGILGSKWAEWSLGVVMVTLASNVATSWWASEHIRGRYEYAESDPARWKREFEETRGKRTAWPVTPTGERVGIATRTIRGLLPLIAGVLLVCGAALK